MTLIEENVFNLSLSFPDRFSASDWRCGQRLLAVSIGDVVIALSHAPAQNQHSLVDAEHMMLSAVASGLFDVTEAAHDEFGSGARIASSTWASYHRDGDRREGAVRSRRK